MSFLLCMALGSAQAGVPWGLKPVLPSLLTPSHQASLEQTELLDKAQLVQLEELRRDVHLEVNALRLEATLEVEHYNDAAALITEMETERLKKLLGERGELFRAWAEQAWAIDEARIQARRDAPPPPSGTVTYEVFGTQYAPNDPAEPDELAVPDVCIKFANLGWTSELDSWGCPSSYQAGNAYSVNVVRDTYDRDVWVGEVGPWNHHDNYWNRVDDPERPRRMWTDLERGMPEAQAAFRDNYNNGQDEFGRTVLNQAGIDLTPQVAETIGLAYLQNDWLEITWLWESGGGSDNEDTDVDTDVDTGQDTGLDTAGDSGMTKPERPGGGCACSSGASGLGGSAWLLGILGLVRRRRSS